MKQVFKHLLIVLQNQADDEQVLARAINLARQHHSKLTLFCSWYKKRQLADINEQAEHYRQQLLQQISQAGIPVAIADISIDWQQPAQRAIDQLLQQHDISLIIKQQQAKRSILSWLVPDVEHYLINSCDLPVWLVKQRTASSELSILACLDVDGSAQQQYQLNDAILSIGEQLVQQDSKQLHILNCYQTDDYSMSLPYDSNHGFAPLPDVQQQHNDKLTPYIAEHQLTAETVHLSEGLPDDEIPKAVQNYHCQLAIIGNSHPHNFSSVLFGDTAHYLSRHTPCDVLIVKQLA
ncbi:Nucleotide-binding universal stress protein, UspA family [Arsukibacterium tuosuense]|uniref:Nucleotide-binding universal stress protein, UspA family n=1 Tax=Arsukibacterium tuosuense TaxID=1323745 RepID=A0A285JKT3_9GAMM|nr:universal stress protein [Arsukibacterium tuosuense]SNY60417.1 Nucleotide-binding universal stress protein, UspA family [Arsukibacterium tuosuense]